MANFAVVGPGIVGTAIAALLKERGYNLVGLVGRNEAGVSARAAFLKCNYTTAGETITGQADIVFITTKDNAIAMVAGELASRGGFRPGQTVIHMSGALPANILSPARDCGARVVSLHPLQSFAGIEMAIENLPGSYFAIEGDKEAYPLAEQIVAGLAGHCLYIESQDKAIYHAAACAASNYLVAIIDYSIKMLEIAGVPSSAGFAALEPLIRGTLNNIGHLGTVRALTGPIARGDTETVERHLRDIESRKKSLADLYCRIGLYTLEVALAKGTIDGPKALELKEILGGKGNE